MQAHSRVRRVLVVAASLAVATGLAQAQSNVIKMVVPFPAGGVTDQAARIVAESMARQLGQTIIIDNRPGAGSRIGIDAVVKAPADGNTLLFTNSSYSILPVVDPKVPFDPLKALVPVGLSATYGLQIVTRKDLPVNTLPEFIAYATKNPGKLSYGSAGIGSGAHFAGEYFKSTSAALADVAGGQLDLAFDASAKPLIDAGRVKLLAVTGDKRDPRFPATPTAPEAGLKGFSAMQSWIGVLAPAATPRSVLERLERAAATAAADPAVHKRLAELGLQAQGDPASRLAAVIGEEAVLYRKIATQAKLQFD